MSDRRLASKMITLVSNDNVSFTISEDWCHHLGDVINVAISLSEDQDVTVPLPDVDGNTLSLVVQFVELIHKLPLDEIPKPLRSAKMSENLPNPNQRPFVDFVDELDHKQLFALITAFNYLNISTGMNLVAAKIASIIKGKNVDEIKEMFQLDLK